eukprot:TRINITY_DN21214_c0_g1_i2.p1 TRINITY_DN21214_c0_g1~~TRINITY_DN21214_c0_g1_i2.p1  ORF type:complete len:4615 (+),score=1185.39 TRINITY_DN21214_c0_g1_i2:107-13846(+)
MDTLTTKDTDAMQMLSQKDITFVVSPPEIVFKNYEPFKLYETPLVFKNQTRTTKSVKVMSIESRFFKLSEPRTTGKTLKVAAGLSVAYTVSFRPEEDTDYECDLIVITESERFVVQVRAFASRGKLDLPAAYTFKDAAVKYNTEKVLYIRNIGIKPTRWSMSVPSPWSISPATGHLEPGSGLQTSLCYKPPQCRKYTGHMVVSYSNGDTSTVELSGDARDVNIKLSTSALMLEPTFISLERQGIVTLHNNSDITVSFQWKAHATLEEEEDEKTRLSELLQRREANEKELIVQSMTRSNSMPASMTNSSREMRSLTRRSKARWRELDKGSLLFEHDYFTIEPLAGELPARSRRDIVITYNPQLAALCEVGAFLDVVGRNDRLPLSLKGQGIGPKCQFSYDALDLGDVFINSIHHYEVMLQNKGSIDAKFSLNQSATLFSSKFKFKPAHGTVPPGEAQTIQIVFCSDIIGILNETFHFHIQGSRTDLAIHFKGRVIGPTFHFDTDEIDFGNVSFNFMHRRSFHLVNTSEIPMRFRLRVPEDQGREKEFECIPNAGLVLPHGKQKVTLDFLSNTVQEYNAHLVVDIDEVGENLHSVPLKASCIVPSVTVVQETLDFGKGGMCFVGHPYDMELEIKNDTPLSSKYDIGLPPEDDPIRRKVDITVDVKKGIVPAMSVHSVKLTLTAKLVGSVHLPIYIRVLGSDKRIPVSLSAKITGPVVTIDQTTVEFGRVNVLTEHQRRVELVNESPIPAVFSCRLLNKSAAFALKNSETTIPPRSTYSLPVYAFLDDTSRFVDELVITVANSKDIQVALVATGTGTTLVPSIPLEQDVDFGNVFTTTNKRKAFTMHNKGKRPLQITWNNDRAKPKEGEPPFTFTISPERATILGKGEQEFVFEGFNDKPGRATERFMCKLAKTHKLVFRPTVVGMFVVPLLEPSEKALNYSYIWDVANQEISAMYQTKPLTLRNVSPMTLAFSLRTGAPFTIDKTEYTLKQGESCTVHVDLFAGYRNDKVSHKLKTKLTIAYKDHPQRETIDLVGDIVFPNLTLECNGASLNNTAGEPSKSLEFGCILHETEKRMDVVVTNCSKVNARYEWVFEQVGVERSSARGDREGVVVSQPGPSMIGCSAFDILPIRGFLKPGESEKVEFIYHSQTAKKAKATAVLVVEGGPEYPVSLNGESSTMHFRFDKSMLDFGNISYERYEERELYLYNIGKVMFSYTIDLTQMRQAGCLEVTPSSGPVKGGEKVRLVVRLYPRMPDKIDDFFQIHVAHFEPHSIYVKAMGLYPSVAVTGNSVTKIQPPAKEELIAEAKKSLAADGRRYFLRGGSGLGMTMSKKGMEDMHKQQAELDEEVERIYFSRFLQKQLAAKKEPAVKWVNPGDPSMEASKEKEAGPYTSKLYDGKPVIACYALDFGTVVKGDLKRKTIKLTNTSSGPVSIFIDKKIFQQSGITVAPDKITKLSGHPSYGEQVLEVHLVTKGDKAKDVTFGNYNLTVPIEVRGGGYITLEVTAFIMVPQLTVSHVPQDTALDFRTQATLPDGSIRERGTTVGETRVISLQLKNPLPLPCEWSIRSEVKKSQPKNQFLCKPERGVLAPKQRCNLEVMFVPFEEGLTNGVLNIKIAQNPRSIQIPCIGIGEEIKVQVDPPVLHMPSVMPFVATESVFVLRNQSKRPVEVYALAFDDVYLIEEEILRAVKIYDSDGVGLMQPREVGGALDDSLLEKYFLTLESKDQELSKAIEAIDANDVQSVTEAAPAPAQPLASSATAGATPDALLGPVIVVFGAPLSGKTTTTSKLAEEYHCDIVSLDETFNAVTKDDTPNSAYIKNILDPWPNEDPVPVKESILSEVLASRFSNCSNGAVIDGLGCKLTNETELTARAVIAAAEKRAIYFVFLDIDEQCIDLRLACIAETEALTKQSESRMPEISEDDYDAMDSGSRREYERNLKKSRKYKKEAQLATKRRIELSKERDAVESKPSIIEVLNKEEEARLAAEQEEAANAKGKKPAAKKGAPVQEVEPPVVEDKTPLGRFKKQYPSVMREVLAHSSVHTVTFLNDNETTVQEMINGLISSDRLPAPNVLSQTSAEDDMSMVPPPVTYLRVEKPKQKEVKTCPWFQILSPPVVEKVQEAVPAQKGKGKGAEAEQEVVQKPMPTRWVLQEGESVKLSLRFCAGAMLEDGFEELIEFGVVGSKQVIPLRCQATSVYPDIVRDPRLTFSSRRSIKKGAFDFGPLLVKEKIESGDKTGKNVKKMSIHKEPDGNIETLKIQNNSPFESQVTWTFDPPDMRTFVVFPSTMKLEPGDCQKIKVTASPEAAGTHDCMLVGLVKDNPVPVTFNLTCVGCLPEVDLSGCEDTPEGKVIDFGKLLLESSQSEDLTITNSTPVPLKWELIDSTDVTKKLRPEFTIEVMHKEKDKAPKHEDPLISRGRLDPKGGKDKETIRMTFSAPKADVIKCDLTLLIKDDVEGIVIQSIPLKLLAEAYDLYLEATEELVLGKNGLVKVGMQHKGQLKLCNRGKYPFSYEIFMKKKYQPLFHLEPSSGVLRPKEPPLIVDVIFESKNEVFFRDTSRAEFEVGIYQDSEPGQGAVVGTKPVYVEVEARTLKFQVVPSHGLNFGPCLCNDKKKMPLDILNNGPFDLKFRLYDMSQGVPDQSATPDPADKKGKKPAKGGAPSGSDLEIGAFKVTPFEGVVSPGDSREVLVLLDPKGAASQVFMEKLGVFIEDCNPDESPEPLALEGESCVPGITADLGSAESEMIFEEQQIVTKLDLSRKLRSVFAKEDRVFSFGSIITHQAVQESFRISNPFTVPCTVTTAVRKRGESEGAVAAMSAFEVAWVALPGQVETDDAQSISIPPHEYRYAKVSFTPTELRSYFALFEAAVKDGTDPKTKELLFEIRGDGSLPQVQVELQPPPPPRVSAEPTQTDAKGKPGKPASTPQPTKYPPNTLVFYRTIVGKRTNRYVTITNVGDLLAEFKFSMPRNSEPFAFPARNSAYELQPGASDSYPVYFEPKQSGNFETKITMSLKDNSFEDTTITLLGEAFEEEVVFEGLDEGCDNFMTLADCGVNAPTQKTFTLESHCKDVLRYQWVREGNPGEDKFTVLPSAGHIMPGKTKEITVSFLSSEPEDLQKVKLTMKTWKVSLAKQTATVWDSSLTSVRWEQDITPPSTPKEVLEEEKIPEKVQEKGKPGKGKKDAGKATPEPEEVREPTPESILSAEQTSLLQKEKELERKRRPLKKVTEPTAEPAFTYIDDEKTPKVKNLFIKAVCDYATWELQADAEGHSLIETGVRFATTKLFQTRTIPIVLKNTGKISLECIWKMLNKSGEIVNTEESSTFAIEPDYCKIPPGSSSSFRLAYAPLDTDPHSAILRGCIPNVKNEGDKQAPQPKIALSGVAECPLVHFDLTESDYLIAGRRNPELSTPHARFIDKTAKVIEFACSGVKVRTTRRFFILNPTNMSYEYEWTDVPDGSKQFICQTPKGVVHSGKKAEMVFEFTADKLDLKEAFWDLRIGGRAGENFFKPITVPFLMVGRTTEPNILLSPTRVNYNQVLLGAKSKKTLQLSNSEPIPFAFNFVVGRGVVSVSPMSGSIPAHSSLPVEVCFSPSSEEAYNCNIVCNVKKKTNPLTCNIKGEGYSIHESLVIKNSDGSTQLLTAGAVNTVDFGRVHINSNVNRQLIISNSGKLHFDYKWSRPPSSAVNLSNEIDTVARNGKSVCELTFNPTRVCNIENYRMVCKITNGASYTLQMQGTGVQPNVHFSVTKIDFAAQFIHIPGKHAQPKKHVLQITNQDKTDISYECNTEPPAWLEVDATPSVLAKNGSKEGGVYTDRREVVFTFKPLEAGKVDAVIPFEINGMFTVNVHVFGEGTIPKVELAAGQPNTISFGSVRAGDVKLIPVKVQCKSKIPTPFSFKDCFPPELDKNLITISPSDMIILKPREIRTVEFRFKPPLGMRLAPFNYNIEAEIASQKRHFLTLMGSSIGMEVHLDQKTLSFGTVVQGTKQSRKALIMNTGDVPVTYQWPELDGSGYSVSQNTGFMLPHSEQSCEITFAPSAPMPESHRELSLKIIDATVTPNLVKVIPISLVGVCSKRPAVAEEQTFKCPVRDTTKNIIKITNNTAEEWVLSPALDTKSWVVPEKVTVLANSSHDMEVMYAPLVMTKTSQKGDKEYDKGTLFLPIPTGDPKQMMHSLIGEAAPPSAEDEIEESVTAKTSHTLLLLVRNWLPTSQRFTVVRDFMIIPPSGSPIPIDCSINVNGANTIDVPPHSQRNYKLALISYKECKIKGTVRFVSDATKEYLYFNVSFNIKAPKDLRTISIKTPARQVMTEDIYIENPLDKLVVLEVSSTGAPGELTHPDKLSVEPRSAGRLGLEYLPLVPGQEKQAKLLLKSPDLGEFPYTLNLTPLPSVPEKSLRFTAPLGQAQQLTVRLRSLAKTPCDFTCKFADPKSPFTKSQPVMVVKAAASTKPDGEEFSFDVTFEPCKFGEARDVLEVSSPVGGTYFLTLLGNCAMPQRQGPYECRSGQAKVIPFKNVFPDTAVFAFATDLPSFTLSKASESIPSKKDVGVQVTYKASPDDPPVAKAKLTVTCQTEASGAPISWVYYLSGVGA